MKIETAFALCRLGCLLLFPGITAAFEFPPGQWVDLSHSFNEQSVYWPTAKTFKKSTVFDGETEGGWHYSAFDFEAAEHGGTHIDAPIHFAENTATTDQIPIEHLVGAGMVMDLTEKTRENRDYQISVGDIEAWEKQYGEIPERAIVLFNTGYARFYPDRKTYMGTQERGAEAVAKLHFPGIHPDAARLLSSRNVNAVGLDTPSLDYGQSKDFMSHRILLGRNIPGLENLSRLDHLPPTGSFVIALPMKIEGGSGGPLRIIAFVPESAKSCCGQSKPNN
ncbi:MAG: cyclase family protein [Gammaproteobacteria bacterium]